MNDYRADAIRRVETIMAQTGLNLHRLAQVAGVAPSTLTRAMRGQTKQGPSGTILHRIEAYARTIEPGAAATAATALRPSLIPARLSVARRSYWDDIGEAADELRMDSRLLGQYENDEVTIPADFIEYFSRETGCPLVWLLRGELAGADPRLAAWIGYLRPDLIGVVLRTVAQGGRVGA